MGGREHGHLAHRSGEAEIRLQGPDFAAGLLLRLDACSAQGSDRSGLPQQRNLTLSTMSSASTVPHPASVSANTAAAADCGVVTVGAGGAGEAFEDYLRPLREVCIWTAGYWNFGPAAQVRWNALQNTSKQIQTLTNFLIMNYKNLVWVGWR